MIVQSGMTLSGLAAVHLAAHGVRGADGEWRLPADVEMSKPAPLASPPVIAAVAVAPVALPAAHAAKPLGVAAWLGEWDSSAALQSEFVRAGDYVAFKCSGRGRVRGHAGLVAAPAAGMAAAVGPAATPDAWLAEWSSSAALQSEFPLAGDYVALKRAEAAGRVRSAAGVRFFGMGE